MYMHRCPYCIYIVFIPPLLQWGMLVRKFPRVFCIWQRSRYVSKKYTFVHIQCFLDCLDHLCTGSSRRIHNYSNSNSNFTRKLYHCLPAKQRVCARAGRSDYLQLYLFKCTQMVRGNVATADIRQAEKTPPGFWLSFLKDNSYKIFIWATCAPVCVHLLCVTAVPSKV